MTDLFTKAVVILKDFLKKETMEMTEEEKDALQIIMGKYEVRRIEAGDDLKIWYGQGRIEI